MIHACAAKSFPLRGLSAIGFLCIYVQRLGRTCADVRVWGVVRADSGPGIAVASNLIGENPDPQHGVITRFKCYFRADTKVFEPPVVDLHESDVMREATSASLADDGQSTGAGAGSVIFSGDVDDPRIEAGFRLGDCEDKSFGDAVA